MGHRMFQDLALSRDLMGEYNECLGPAAEQKLTVMVFLAVLFACSPGRYYPRLRVSSFLQFFPL